MQNVNKSSSFLKTDASFNTDKGSDSPGFIKKQSFGNNNSNTNGYAEVIYNHSSLTHEESSHLLGKNQNSLANSPRNDNLSNYSTDDLSIVDDESQNSLASLLLR